jgi:hypothetical protein
MKQNRNLVATALLALFAAATYAACPASSNLAEAAAVASFKTDGGVPRNLVAQHESSDGRVPRNRDSVPTAEGAVPNTGTLAARSAEGSLELEHRKPPPKHLVDAGNCKDLNQERPMAG